MADGGKMYTVFDMDFAKQMTRLCAKADIIVPNFTEAAFMLARNTALPPTQKNMLNRRFAGSLVSDRQRWF